MRLPARVGGMLWVLIATLAVGCSGKKDKADAGAATVAPPAHDAGAFRVSKTGPGFRLSDADGDAPSARANAAAAEPLGAAETAKLFARLPRMKTDPSDVQSFALRTGSIRAPRPGETVTEPFPPASSAPRPAAPGPNDTPPPLTVTRHEPDGNVPLAPYLSVSFSAPMVPVTSHQDLAELPVPVKLTPEPPGKWRWVGTQTAMFQPDGRFPMATDYSVDIDAGTKSATGALLARAEHYTFSTPAPAVRDHGPSGESVELRPLIFARFDQGIDPAAVLATTQVLENGAVRAVRLATPEEMANDHDFLRIAELRVDDSPLSLGWGTTSGPRGGSESAARRRTGPSR